MAETQGFWLAEAPLNRMLERNSKSCPEQEPMSSPCCSAKGDSKLRPRVLDGEAKVNAQQTSHSLVQD